MSGMKDSGVAWIGDIPAEWEIAPLKYHLKSLQSGGTPDSSDASLYDGDIPFVTISDITAAHGRVVHTQEKISEKAKRDKGLEIIHAGTLLYTIYATLGSTSILEVDACINQAILAITPDQRLSQRYLLYFFDSLKPYIPALASSNTQQNLNAQKIKNVPVILPGFEEQISIAKKLDSECKTIDEATATLEEEVSALERYRASVIHEAVTKGLDPSVPTKPSGVEWIGEIPACWSINRLRYLASIESGATPSKDDLSYWEGRIPWVSSMEVKRDLLFDTSLHISEKAVASCSTRVLPKGTLVMVVRSGILQHTIPVSILGKPMTINQDIKAFKFNESMLPRYFFYFVKGNNDNLLKTLLKDKSTVDNINQEYLKSLRVPVPPVAEQANIVDFLDERIRAINAVLDTKSKQLDILKRRRQSLIYEYVTGKRRVNGQE
jgi:type I restriction enzyme S subunit